MSEISVESVDRDQKEVTLRVQNVYFVFQRTKGGKMRCVSKHSFNSTNLWVPKHLYSKAVKRASAVIRDMERRPS